MAAALALASLADAEPMKQSDAIVGLLNSPSSQSPARYAEAAERVAADAKAGLPLQRYMLAVLAGADGLFPVAQLDEETRREYLEGTRERIRAFAEKRNNPLAWYLLSMEYNDIGLLKRAVDGGNVQALNAYGTYLVHRATRQTDPADTNAVSSLMKEGFGCFSRAAATGDANGLYNLGLCYMHGMGCGADGALAFGNMRKAAEAGHPDAMEDVSTCCERGVGTDPSEVRSTLWKMRARAARGDRAAAEWLAANPLPEDD